MMRRSLMLTVLGLGMVGMLSLGASPALALSFTGNYFVLAPNHPDTLGNIDGSTVSGLVGPALLGGLPVYTGVVPPASGPITNVDGANRIQWWTAQAGVVSVDASVGGGTGIRSDAFVGNVLGGPAFGSSFYPSGNANNANGYRAVHWQGVFNVGAGGATLSLTGDDDAWLFLNGALALDNGGVKAITVANTVSTNLVAGDYVAELWFADRHQTQSGIAFTCEGCLDPIPEPATLLLFGTTLAGLGAVVRRRMKGQKATTA
jgi:fibro-slime domain-containing protein